MTHKMNAEIKKQWVEALRSGDYEQGREALKLVEDDETVKHCCLGVLCDLYQKANGGDPDWSTESLYDSFGVEPDTELLPIVVSQWAGLGHSDNPGTRKRDEEEKPLAGHNDAGETFACIADMIESQL